MINETLVRDFMAGCNRPLPEAPTIPTDANIALCVKLIHEECFEAIEAMGFKANGNLMNRVVGMPCVRDVAKELMDVIYVALHAAYIFGIPIEACWTVVALNNLAKLGEGHSFRADGKLLPPPGFKKEDLSGVIG